MKSKSRQIILQIRENQWCNTRIMGMMGKRPQAHEYKNQGIPSLNV